MPGVNDPRPPRLPAAAYPLPGVECVPTYNRWAMSATPLPDLFLYTRPGCGLCDEALDLLRALLAERTAAGLTAPRIVERDIETDPAWERAFFASIPVVEFGDRRLELATSVAKLHRLLTETLDAEAASPTR